MQSNLIAPVCRPVLICLLIAVCLMVPEGGYCGSPIQDYLAGKSEQTAESYVSDPQVLSAETDQETSSGSSFVLHQLYDDVTNLISEPDFYGVVGGIAATPSLFGSAFRRESPELTEQWGPSVFADGLFEAGEIIGDGRFPIAASVASWGLGKVVKSSRLSRFGSDLFRAQAVNGLLTAVLKAGINRTRPNGGPYSYPSGHTSSAFATAGTVYSDFGKKWGIPAFALAGYVGLSRLQEGKHYISDVVAGGILGTYVSLKLARRRNEASGFSVAPTLHDGAVGVSFDMKF